MQKQNQYAPYLAEFFGTFVLVFIGCGAAILAENPLGPLNHLGVSLAFGLSVMVMIYSMGEISGAHFNPAVSFAFVVARGFPFKEFIRYAIAQMGGAVLASFILKLFYPHSQNLGMTLPHLSLFSSLVSEIILSLILMFVILSVSTGSKEKGITAGLAIGFTVTFAALMGGPIAGASMNPARSFGPALLMMNFEHFWIYLVGPLLGTCGAVFVCRWIQKPGCCERVCP